MKRGVVTGFVPEFITEFVSGTYSFPTGVETLKMRILRNMHNYEGHASHIHCQYMILIIIVFMLYPVVFVHMLDIDAARIYIPTCIIKFVTASCIRGHWCLRPRHRRSTLRLRFLNVQSCSSSMSSCRHRDRRSQIFRRHICSRSRRLRRPDPICLSPWQAAVLIYIWFDRIVTSKNWYHSRERERERDTFPCWISLLSIFFSEFRCHLQSFRIYDRHRSKLILYVSFRIHAMTPQCSKIELDLASVLAHKGALPIKIFIGFVPDWIPGRI